jgi:hypothetical protein
VAANHDILWLLRAIPTSAGILGGRDFAKALRVRPHILAENSSNVWRGCALLALFCAKGLFKKVSKERRLKIAAL